MRRWMLALMLLVATPAAADEITLLGAWDFEVIDGTAKGDHGEIYISEQDGKLVADQIFNDVDAGAWARERCEISRHERQVTIRCSVLTVSGGAWWPDDYDLSIVNPSKMVGRLLSATTGTAVFTRREQPGGV